ncbi:MAG: hypothetical protein HYU05_01170 [Candidatus Wildermuthbacteria bacterium]|nr:hypothetical protein [Candidatus Wildermuthbacteria bacterium]
MCATCRKETKVVFLPDGKRPVYCKACRKKMKSAETQEVSLSDVSSQKPVMFHPADAKKSVKAPESHPSVISQERQQGLREALSHALEKKQNPVPDSRAREISPGETIYFSREEDTK